MTPARRASSLRPPCTFGFLNAEHDLDVIGWDCADVPKLWRYNLHYFDDLNADHASQRRDEHVALMSRWIEENPIGRGVGWEPYPTSLRIVNWVKWLLKEGSDREYPALCSSVALQARWLRGRLETHLLGNHLFANAKALVHAGMFFEGEQAEEWLEVGLRIIEQEMREQVLPDGGHFERSPMYHAIFLEDLIDLINLMRTYGDQGGLAQNADTIHVCATNMLSWLLLMTRPDGSLAQFNDCAQGIAPTVDELERYAHELGIYAQRLQGDGTVLLEASGYVVGKKDSLRLIFDVAPIEPDYLPGHAHADTLSLELTYREMSVVVNGGTSRYGVSSERVVERSTSAHSTVEVAGGNSSEVWSGFRVGRRARPFDLSVTADCIACSHDGYRYLRGKPVHRRRCSLGNSQLRVDDSVSTARVTAIARYIIAPGLKIREQSPGTFDLLSGDKEIAVINVLEGQSRVATAAHSPEFGITLQTDCLEIELCNGQATCVWNFK